MFSTEENILVQKNVANNASCADYTLPQYITWVTQIGSGPYRSWFEKKVSRDSLPAVAFAGKYAREVKAADMKDLQVAIYWVP